MPDITLVNLNLLFMRYGSSGAGPAAAEPPPPDQIERELHLPLGCLYLTRALEQANLQVDLRDYQLCTSYTPFDMDVFLSFMADPAPVIGLSCMANLLPFTILAMKALKQRYPDRTLVLGGVGAKGVEDQVLRRFGWVDVICRGEGELTGPELLSALREGRDLSTVRGISYREGVGGTRLEHGCKQRSRGTPIVHNPDRPRIRDVDSIGLPAWEKVDLSRYAGYGMMTSRGCPYQCTFCSVAPVWNLESYSRSPESIVSEMAHLHRQAGVTMFLFQDEFFVSGKKQVLDFCRELRASGLSVHWKAFGRVNLVDEEMMRAMAECGCVELRFGVESGSDAVLRRIRKGFTAAQSLEVIPKAIPLFPRVDAFFVWGFPFETIEDFRQSLFQMVSFRMMGARILPSLLSLLPQTDIYREYAGRAKLEFCPYLLPEFVFTGHEVAVGGEVEIPLEYGDYFRLIMENPDIFPGFFHIDLAGNVLPKLQLLREFGFYPTRERQAAEASPQAPPAGETGSCGAHSPRLRPGELATKA